MRILITAGPTREHIDPVRYISNASTGSMGFALAEAARKAGHKVILVSGPTHLNPLRGVEFVSVVSAREMYREVIDRFGRVDAVVMNAAVSDYRPRRSRTRKIKKSDSELELELELVANPDILQVLGRRKKRQRLMGFALETHRGLTHARKKLREKNLDWIVLNSPSAIGAVRMEATLLTAKGQVTEIKNVTKPQLARRLIQVVSAGA